MFIGAENPRAGKLENRTVAFKSQFWGTHITIVPNTFLALTQGHRIPPPREAHPTILR